MVQLVLGCGDGHLRKHHASVKHLQPRRVKFPLKGRSAQLCASVDEVLATVESVKAQSKAHMDQ
jgi:hypothetical protein